VSYDLQVWSTAQPDFKQIATSLEGWAASEGSLTFSATSWQIVAGPTSNVEEEDIPEEIYRALPGIRYLTELNLEPIHAPASARKALGRAAARLAQVGHGLVLDRQQGTLSTPRGVRRVISPSARPEERIAVLQLSWWFDGDPLHKQGGFERLLVTLERYLPEALPRRYGDHEPPRYRYESEGREHFLGFLANEKLAAVWYPHYPVLSVWPGVYGGFGPQRQGYRSKFLAVTVDASAWAQPGWALALRRFWFAMSGLLGPFFGEVRLLGGHLLRRGRDFIDSESVLHPVRNGWWNGVPANLGPATVLGQPYAALWPKFVRYAERQGGLYFLTGDDWLSNAGVERIVGKVPRRIAQGRYSDPYRVISRTTYPRDWPFEGPFAED
jgi:hypothetical protein